MKKKQLVQAVIVAWEGDAQFVVLTDNPAKIKKVIAKVEKKLQIQWHDEYTSDDLREELRGKQMVCVPFWGEEYNMLP
jgi:predicted secreted protein